MGLQLQTVLGQLRRLACREQTGALSDAELLRRYLVRRDEAAFESLVWRHGPMVLGVCRRLVRHEQDAEDAFQAVFLAFARAAGTVTRRESVGGWLYRIAHAWHLDQGPQVPGQMIESHLIVSDADGRNALTVVSERGEFTGLITLANPEG
jgi:hypothetical protein